MIESYQAYGDWKSIAELTRKLVQNAAMAISGSHVVTHHDGRKSDLGGTWKEIFINLHRFKIALSTELCLFN